MSKLLKKKSQIWYFDFVIALSMFLVVLVFSFKYINETYIFDDKSPYIAEADRVAGRLMSEGVPKDWTNESVTSIGLTSENSLNTTKLSYFINMTNADYPKTKLLFGLRNDFLIYFENRTGQTVNFSDQQYVGMPGKTPFNLDEEERVDITRYLVYKQDDAAEILAMQVIVWK